MAIDVGTNGEIVLISNGKIHACSTAAGSAFEGATISFGMRAQEGAIEYVSISDPDEPPDFATIGNASPIGLCGSGIVDVVAELRRCNIVSPDGRLRESGRTTSKDDKDFGFIVVDEEEHGSEKRILFTQKDIRQVQLAKAAIQAGTKVLMEFAGLKLSDVNSVLLAGAFGNYIRPASALRIGLLPPIDLTKIFQVGNTAGIGAKLMLVSEAMRDTAEYIAKTIVCINLAGHPSFESFFIESTHFP